MTELTRQQRELVGVFRHKLGMLEKMSTSTNVNDLIESAGLLRDLVLSEGSGLTGELFRYIPEMRNNKGLISFEMKYLGSSVHELNSPTQWTETNSQYCLSHGKLKDGIYSRDQFLKMPSFCTPGQHFTIKDIIVFVANKLGARHFDYGRASERNDILHSVRETFGLENFDPIVHQLMGISSIVLSTLCRVDDKIKELEQF